MTIAELVKRIEKMENASIEKTVDEDTLYVITVESKSAFNSVKNLLVNYCSFKDMIFSYVNYKFDDDTNISIVGDLELFF